MESLADRVRRLEPRRVCIIKPSSLGDVVHSLPILPALRALFPSSRISWVVNSAFRGLLESHPHVDQVIAFERGGSGISPQGASSAIQLCARLLRESFDLTIDLQGLLRSGIMAAATRASVRVGIADAREGATWFYTHRVAAQRHGLHAVDRVGRVAMALGLAEFRPEFLIIPSEQDQAWARDVLGPVRGPRLVLNLGARWKTKQWPPEHFAEIARRAAAEFGSGLVCVGGRTDLPLAAALTSAVAPLKVLNLCGQTTLLQLASVAQQSHLFLSNDTGPLHLAAAAGASVVGVYTCTDPRLTGPHGQRVNTVQSCVWCAPSFRRTCRRLECFAELSPDRVWPVVRQRLIASFESAA